MSIVIIVMTGLTHLSHLSPLTSHHLLYQVCTLSYCSAQVTLPSDHSPLSSLRIKIENLKKKYLCDYNVDPLIQMK